MWICVTWLVLFRRARLVISTACDWSGGKMETSHWLNEAKALQLGVSAMDLHFLALNIHHLSHNVQKLDTPFLRENQVNKQDRLKFLSLLGILRSGINVLHFFQLDKGISASIKCICTKKMFNLHKACYWNKSSKNRTLKIGRFARNCNFRTKLKKEFLGISIRDPIDLLVLFKAGHKHLSRAEFFSIILSSRQIHEIKLQLIILRCCFTRIEITLFWLSSIPQRGYYTHLHNQIQTETGNLKSVTHSCFFFNLLHFYCSVTRQKL